MEKKKKLIILGVIILILAISGITYAILTWTSSKINIGLTSNCFTIDYTKGQDISGNLKLINVGELFDGPGNFVIKEGMGLSYANLGIKSSCTIEGYGSLYLNITTLSDAFKEGGDSYNALGYALLRNTSNLSNDKLTIENLKGQSFEIIDIKPITNTGTIKLVTEQLSNTELNKYLIVIFVDSVSAGNSITSATFNGNISADAEQSVPSTPDYCFTLSDKDETNKTATLGSNSYNCYEGNENNYNVITDVIVPSKIDGYTITKITGDFSYNTGPKPFTAEGNINSIILPEGLLEIGAYAFYFIGLSDVTIPDSVTTIRAYSFYGNQLTSITIPDLISKIESYTFSNNKLTSVTIPDSVTMIEDGAFSENQLTKIIIPNSVEYIKKFGFSYNNLNYVLINSGSKLKSISKRAFSSSNATSTSSNGVTYVDNPNLKIIYNNSGKAFDWNMAVNEKSGTTFVTGTTNGGNNGSTMYKEVTITTGQPS